MKRRLIAAGWILALAVAAASGPACRRGENLTELERFKSGALDVVLLSDHDAIRHGRDTFTIEFRSASDGNLVDVGNVRASATMPMPGTPMLGTIDVQRAGVPGRYTASSRFDMAGTWRLTIEWDGPAGRGSANLSGRVQ